MQRNSSNDSECISARLSIKKNRGGQESHGTQLGHLHLKDHSGAVIAASEYTLSAAGDLRNGREHLRNLSNDGKEGWNKWLHLPANSTWVQLDFKKPTKISSYGMCSANDCPERDPDHFELQTRSSPDGEWDTVHEVTSCPFLSRPRWQWVWFDLDNPNPKPDQEENVDKFVKAEDFTTYEELISGGKIGSVNVVLRDNNNTTAVCETLSNAHSQNRTKTINKLLYIFTSHLPIDMSWSDLTNKGSYLHWMLSYGSSPEEAMKLVIDFNGDTRDFGKPYRNETPLDLHTRLNSPPYKSDKKFLKILTEYLPSEEEKLTSQLEYKQRVDLIFKDKGCPRFKQAEIDLKFQSIDAVKTGDLELLLQCLPHVDESMAISLTSVAVEKEYSHLFDCLCEKILWSHMEDLTAAGSSFWNSRRSGEGLTVFDSIIKRRNYFSIEPLLFTGLDATPYSRCSRPDFKPRHSLVDSVNRSRVLCLFKVLYHKFIYLGFDSIFQLAGILLFECMYDVGAIV